MLFRVEFELNEETSQPNVIINSKSSKNIGSFLNMISANTTQVSTICAFSRKNSNNRYCDLEKIFVKIQVCRIECLKNNPIGTRQII